MKPNIEARTYDEWKRLGAQVAKGETATGRNANGVPTFTINQLRDYDEDPFDADEVITDFYGFF